MIRYLAKIKCFYCGQEFLLEIRSLFHLKSYCDNCKKKHYIVKNGASAYQKGWRSNPVSKEAFEKYQKYLIYREKLKDSLIVTESSKISKKEKPKEIRFIQRSERIFKIDGEKEIYWGTILLENEEIVIVSKSALDIGTPVQKKIHQKGGIKCFVLKLCHLLYFNFGI